MSQRWGLLLFLALFSAAVGPAEARVLRVEVESRDPVLDGTSFGSHGAYELLRGTIVFAVDPAHPRHQSIVDVRRAPRNSTGRVRTRANFAVLQPVDPETCRGTGLVEVSNRGGKFSLPYFNRATASLDPDNPDSFGDGLLVQNDLTMIWIGWQWDVPREGNSLRLEVPIAQPAPGGSLGGTVRSDWGLDGSTQGLPLVHRGHVPYKVADVRHAANVLTVRADRGAPRRVVPREEWQFVRVTTDGKGASQVDSMGNEQAGVQNVGVRVPLATYTPWNLRLDAVRNRDELTDFSGSFVPLSRTPEEKGRTNDPRPAVTTLYESRTLHLDRVSRAADRLICQGYLLKADRQRVLERAKRLWEWVMADDRSTIELGEREN